MSIEVRALAIIIGISLMILIVELVRRRKLREEYSWIWLFLGGLILLFSFCPDIVFLMAKMLNVTIPFLIVLLFSIILLFILSIYFSVKLSVITRQIEILAQKLTILESSTSEQHKVERIKS